MDMFPEWNEPVDEAELQAIESAYISRSASALDRTSSSTAGGGGAGVSRGSARKDIHHLPKTNGRRLPNWTTPAAAASPFSGRYGASYSPDQRQRKMWSLSAPTGQAHLKLRHPMMTFGGHIVYSRTVQEVERAAKELLDIMDSRRQGGNRVPIGFDIEWKPTFRKGETTRKAAVVQLCVDKGRCYVMHIIHSGIPSVLKFLLGDNSSVKVGVGIANDAIKIRNDYNVNVEDVEDLSGLANRKLGGPPKQWSLSALTEMVTCKQLAKPKQIRLGNWEAHVLSKAQLAYAATDAFVSWYLYEALTQFPDADVRDETALPSAAVDTV